MVYVPSANMEEAGIIYLYCSNPTGGEPEALAEGAVMMSIFIYINETYRSSHMKKLLLT